MAPCHRAERIGRADLSLQGEVKWGALVTSIDRER
jgi:hypothetical protein